MLRVSASTSRAGFWPVLAGRVEGAAGGGAMSLAGSGGAGRAAVREGWAGAGAVRISVDCRRSACRRGGADGFLFGGGDETRASEPCVAACSFRRAPPFMRGALKSAAGPSPCGPDFARGVAADLPAAALAGLELPRTLGWLGVLAI